MVFYSSCLVFFYTFFKLLCVTLYAVPCPLSCSHKNRCLISEISYLLYDMVPQDDYVPLFFCAWAAALWATMEETKPKLGRPWNKWPTKSKIIDAADYYDRDLMGQYGALFEGCMIFYCVVNITHMCCFCGAVLWAGSRCRRENFLFDWSPMTCLLRLQKKVYKSCIASLTRFIIDPHANDRSI